MSERECFYCDGTGEQVDDSDPDFIERCAECNGTGFEPEEVE